VNSEINQTAVLETRTQVRNATILGALITLLLAGAIIFVLANGLTNALWTILPLLLAALVYVWLARTTRHIAGGIFFISVISTTAIISPLFASGLGLTGAISALAVIGGIGLATLPRRYFGSVLFTGLVIAAASLFIDVFAQGNRPPVSASELQIRWTVSIVAFLVFAAYFARQFFTLDIQTKIVLGILVTGGIALGTLALFAVDRTRQITESLSGRLETGVKLLAEEQLINTITDESTQINGFFAGIVQDIEGLAKVRVSLQRQSANLGQGTYWDSHTNLIQLDGGQYGNPASDLSSVFVPINTELTEETLAGLNVSAYLDFSIPNTLQGNPLILAVYYIDTNGITRYYPNINLASLLPPDFDATSRPYFEITAPLFNSKRLTRWTIPYVDAAGGGLVVTAAAPVYFGDRFDGVIAADVQLSKATEQVAAIKIGQTGFAFMIDDAGRIIAMPPAGYAMFEINPEELPQDEFFKQTVLMNGSDDVNAITRRMASGGNGLNIIKIDGVDNYIAYAPIKTNGYSLAIVVPVAEMQEAIALARAETDAQIRSVVQVAVILFSSLLLFAIVISVLIGRIIASPIIQLTGVANQIVEGNLGAQAAATSQDEIGTLAKAFNTMTLRLRETLEGLEKRVDDRTAELTEATQRVERRARQFASISEISRVINQTQSLQDLLPQISQVISQQLGFYHVGIFLLNATNEYAELAAANSEGGQRMLARGHKLKVGQVGIVGNVANTGVPRIALDTVEDAVFFNNPDLPETHSEMALPLFRAGRQIIGVLDVQSTETNAFTQEDIQVLSALAEQVSIAITNSRLYEETQKALIEADMVYRSQLRTGWQKYTRNLKLAGIRRKGTRSVLLSEPVDVPGFETVTTTGGIVEVKPQDDRTGGYQITLPVKLRGEIVGVLNLKSDEPREWTPDQLDIINAIVERAALSIESSRLLLESQRQAAKERIIGEISAKVSTFTNRNNILQAAAEEIGRALPGADITIQVQKPKNGNVRSSGDKK
jgi:GAF domain-containing protein/HAMP domain-containing protein